MFFFPVLQLFIDLGLLFLIVFELLKQLFGLKLIASVDMRNFSRVNEWSGCSTLAPEVGSEPYVEISSLQVRFAELPLQVNHSKSVCRLS